MVVLPSQAHACSVPCDTVDTVGGLYYCMPPPCLLMAGRMHACVMGRRKWEGVWYGRVPHIDMRACACEGRQEGGGCNMGRGMVCVRCGRVPHITCVPPLPVRAGRRHGSNMWEGYGMCSVWEGSPYYMRAPPACEGRQEAWE